MKTDHRIVLQLSFTVTHCNMSSLGVKKRVSGGRSPRPRTGDKDKDAEIAKLKRQLREARGESPRTPREKAANNKRVQSHAR